MYTLFRGDVTDEPSRNAIPEADMEFDLEQFAAHLDKLEDELRKQPSLRHIIDADLEHNLSALRLMGIVPRDSTPVAVLSSEPAAVKPNRHGGTRQGAGRKKIVGSSNAERCRRYRRKKGSAQNG